MKGTYWQMEGLQSSGFSELVRVLVCPACRSELQVHEQGLKCNSCTRTFRVANGIPVLLDEADPVVAQRAASEEGLYRDMVGHDALPPNPGWAVSKQHLYSTIRELITRSRPDRVLYAGCGRDVLAIQLLDTGATFVNADIVFDAVDELRGLGAPWGVCCDVRNLPFADGSFDLILTVDLLHHFASDGLDGPISRLAGALGSGGTLVIQEPNRYALFRLLIACVPLPLRQVLRRMKRVFKRNKGMPAPYEAPISASLVTRLLKQHGLGRIRFVPCAAYPGGTLALLFARVAERVPILAYKFGYHFMLTAEKVLAPEVQERCDS